MGTSMSKQTYVRSPSLARWLKNRECDVQTIPYTHVFVQEYGLENRASCVHENTPTPTTNRVAPCLPERFQRGISPDDLKEPVFR